MLLYNGIDFLQRSVHFTRCSLFERTVWPHRVWLVSAWKFVFRPNILFREMRSEISFHTREKWKQRNFLIWLYICIQMEAIELDYLVGLAHAVYVYWRDGSKGTLFFCRFGIVSIQWIWKEMKPILGSFDFDINTLRAKWKESKPLICSFGTLH